MRAADSIDACISGPLAMGAAWVMNGSAASAGGTVPGSLPERLNDCWVEPPGASVDWRGAGVSDVRGPCSAPEEDRGAGDCDERGTAAPLVPEGEVEGGGEADEALAGGGVNENITVVRGSGTSPPRGICPTTSGAWRGSGVTLTITELQSSSRLAGLAPSEGLGDTEPSGAMGAHSKGFSSRGEGLAIVGSITFVGSWARSSTARWLCGFELQGLLEEPARALDVAREPEPNARVDQLCGSFLAQRSPPDALQHALEEAQGAVQHVDALGHHESRHPGRRPGGPSRAPVSPLLIASGPNSEPVGGLLELGNQLDQLSHERLELGLLRLDAPPRCAPRACRSACSSRIFLSSSSVRPPARRHLNRLLLAGLAVAGRHRHDALGVDLEGDVDLHLAALGLRAAR